MQVIIGALGIWGGDVPSHPHLNAALLHVYY